MLPLLLAVSLFAPFVQGSVAVVELRGSIGEDVDPQDVVSILGAVDAEYDALILDIDSPGGTPAASHELVRALGRMEIPTVALVRESATSGAYWVAAACDRVVADELSLVGSLGALMGFVSVEGLAEKYGVSADVVSYPENKSFGSPFRDLSPEELSHAQQMTRSAGDFFNSSILELRPGAAKYFTGLPYLARDAPELVDEFGGFQEAREAAEELAGRQLEPEFISAPRSWRELFQEAIGLRADSPFNFLQLVFKLPDYM